MSLGDVFDNGKAQPGIFKLPAWSFIYAFTR
jgi:hypothetical protein